MSSVRDEVNLHKIYFVYDFDKIPKCHISGTTHSLTKFRQKVEKALGVPLLDYVIKTKFDKFDDEVTNPDSMSFYIDDDDFIWNQRKADLFCKVVDEWNANFTSYQFSIDNTRLYDKVGTVLPSIKIKVFHYNESLFNN